MFYLYHHNDLARLAELFGALRDNYRPSPLTEDIVLVPNRGIGRWLAIQIAESDARVVANLRAALPGQWLWQLIERLMPDAHAAAREFESDRLPWHLYRALPHMARRIPEIAAYLGSPVDDIRRWQLAARLADVFDRYLVYRGDMLARWQAGDRPSGTAGWQSDVWRYLVEDYALGKTHRASIVADLARRLDRDTLDAALSQALANHCPPRLYLFGLVAVAPDQLRLAYALARHVDVHFLLPNPSEAYWGDVTARRLALALPDDLHELPGEAEAAEHPLLAGFGRMARDTLRLLYADEFAGMVEPEFGEAMAYDVPADDSLLHRVQADIVTLEPRVSDAGMEPDDTSIEIHACHSPLREIQVLHDQLLDRLAADATLAPRDIVVMLPEVATYVPAIQAVFGGASDGRRLPFTVADRAQSALHPIVSAVTGLFDLPLWRWEASRLLDLLAVPAVRRRFALDEADVARLTDWIDASGIRWGRDADHRRSLAAGAFEQNSWRFGLDRLLLGVAQADDDTLVDGVAPWSDLEGGTARALGGLARFVSVLGDFADRFAEACEPAAWQTRLNAILDALIEPSRDAPDEARAIETLRTAFASFEDAAAAFEARPGAGDTTLEWTAVRDHLRALLDGPSERQPFISGGITFCGLVPLRAVPFRVVCVLGVNDGVFPRQDSDRGFNLLFDAPRLGDPSRRDDDRLLFLQALTAARDALYLSYIGQDMRTGEGLPPSPVVGELMAFLHAYYFHGWSRDVFEKRLVHHQPMQPFSARYFDPAEADPRVFTYAGDWREASVAARGARRGAEPWLDDSRLALDEPIRAVDLDTLVRFFDDPPKAFFERQLGLKLERDSAAIDDHEPIELDPLAQSILRRRLFDHTAPDAEQIDTQPDALELARGKLPPPPRATRAYAREADIVNTLLPVRRAWQSPNQTRETIAVDFTIAGVRLTGRIPDVGPTHRRAITTGRLRTRFRLRQWIIYLVLVAAGHERGLTLAGLSPKKDDSRVVAVEARLTPEAARDHLAVLVDIFLAGQQAPVHFHPDMADDYKPDGDDPFGSLWKRYSESQSFQASHLVNNPCFRLLLGDDDAPLGAEADNPFIAALDAITQPMHEALEEIDPPAVATAETAT